MSNTEEYISAWIDNRRQKHFLRLYYEPLKDKWRSWIGLLLAVRFFLLITFLANSLGDPSINLLAISITTSLIVDFKTLYETVYTNWCLDALDLFFEIKLGLFSVSTLYIRNVNGNQSILSNVFLSVSCIFGDCPLSCPEMQQVVETLTEVKVQEVLLKGQG